MDKKTRPLVVEIIGDPSAWLAMQRAAIDVVLPAGLCQQLTKVSAEAAQNLKGVRAAVAALTKGS